MNKEFLDKLLVTRAQEIKEGKNLSTAQPIYVVLDLQENIVSGHSDYSPSVNMKGHSFDHGYVDVSLSGDDIEFNDSDEDMTCPEEVTRFYTDRFVAFFLTSSGAQDYLKYQKHNLTMPYVYVFYSGYGNREMNELLQGS